MTPDELTAAGFSLFPCQTTGNLRKRPHPKIYWRDLSSRSMPVIEKWLRQYGEDQVAWGIDLAKCGMIVIDCDCKPGQPDGWRAFQELCAAHNFDISTVPQVRTPSGGVHCYFQQVSPLHGNSRGALPAGIDVRGNGGFAIAPGSVIDTGAYVLANGRIERPAPMPEWLLGILRPTHTKVPKPVFSGERRDTSHYVRAAIDAEVAKVRSAPEGQRNNTLNEATFALATIPDLSDHEIADVMVEAGAEAGLPIAEIRATIKSAIKAGRSKPRSPWPPANIEPEARPLVKIDELLIDRETGEIVQQAQPASDADHFPLGLCSPPGLVGEIADWIVSTARRPQPILALGAALTIVGTAAGRHVGGPTRSGTQLYVIGLARSGYGKDHPLQSIGRILAASGMSQHFGPSEFISMPAVINFLSRMPLSVCAMDEFGAFLKRINNRRASGFEQSISKILRTAWSSSFATLMTPEWAGRSAVAVQSPCLSIYGISTPDEFYQALSGSDVANGLLNRCLLLVAPEKPVERDPFSDATVVPDGISSALQAVYYRQGDIAGSLISSQIMPTIYEVSWEGVSVRERHAEFSASVEAEAEAHPDRAPFLGRTAEMALRLGTIVAIGRDPTQAALSLADYEWGATVALWSARAMARGAAEHIAETQHQADSKMVLAMIRKSGRIRRTDLLRGLAGRLDSRTLASILALHIDAGVVQKVSVSSPGRGRPAEEYIALGLKQSLEV